LFVWCWRSPAHRSRSAVPRLPCHHHPPRQVKPKSAPAAVPADLPRKIDFAVSSRHPPETTAPKTAPLARTYAPPDCPNGSRPQVANAENNPNTRPKCTLGGSAAIFAAFFAAKGGNILKTAFSGFIFNCLVSERSRTIKRGA